MLKPLAKLTFLSFILVFTLLAGGCQSLFIPKNVPIVLWDGVPSKTPASREINIQSFNTITPGTIHDITNSGNALIIINAGNLGTNLNIDSYDTDTQALSSFISSDKRELSALYDTFDTGIYYVEETVDPITEKTSSQLSWTDINKNTTRIISLPEENVMKHFGIGESNQVVYGNTNNEIIIADNRGNRQVYTQKQNYSIISVDYMKEANAFIFMATAPNADDQTNLYYAPIDAESAELLPILIEENVIDFNINSDIGQLIYVKNTGKNQLIGTWSANSDQATSLATGNFGSARYTPNGEKIIYTQSSPNVDSQSQSIWIMDANGKNPLQVTVPLKLNSQVISHPSKSILYFSVDTAIEDPNTSKSKILSQTYQITYTIE
ncbi:MAG: hypothetical protein ACOH15_05160 [Acetobacterium sp.]